MSNILQVESTWIPENKPDFNTWGTHIQKQNLFGIAVLEGLKTDPEGTIKMIREQYKDHPVLVTKSLGAELIKKIIP
jgi:hypothetical protein